MSIHPSLRSKGKSRRSRSVLKRYERLQQLQEKEKWQYGDSVFGLPKLKTLRLKAKKAKKAAETEATALTSTSNPEANTVKKEGKTPKK